MMAEQENNMEMVEFQFPDEAQEQETQEQQVEAAESDFEVEDDTPEQDRGREPLPENVVKELEEDELNDYSERVRTRMAQLKKVWHDERRAKEATLREREEALRVAQQIIEENKRLKATLSSGEEMLMQSMREAAEREFDIAKREYKEAYDAGDTERVIEAQQRLTNAQFRVQQATGYRPQFSAQKALQEQTAQVYTEPERPQISRPDTKAVAWQDRNPWFGTDEEMTSLALGLHEKLVKSGVDPRSDDYYSRIDNTMRKRFPEYFGGTQEQAKPTPRAKPATVVAPATRSTAPKKIVLTKTQVNLAKRLGITPEQYARELMKENANG
jgi:hypothetical protein